MFYDLIDSPLGSLAVVASNQGLRKVIHCASRPEEVFSVKRSAEFSPKKLSDIVQSMRAFMAGEIHHLDIPVEIHKGTDLQRAVWNALQEIPYGERISYTELAERVQRPRAVRAVASACGANPVPVIVPCHRVVAKDGGLGGFAWGLKNKEWLLDLESRKLQNELLAA